jgi:hypothetical protein
VAQQPFPLGQLQPAVAVDRDNSREVSCGFFVFCLLFRQVSCEGDDVVIDLFMACTDIVAVAVSTVRSHDYCCAVESMRGESKCNEGLGTWDGYFTEASVERRTCSNDLTRICADRRGRGAEQSMSKTERTRVEVM